MLRNLRKTLEHMHDLSLRNGYVSRIDWHWSVFIGYDNVPYAVTPACHKHREPIILSKLQFRCKRLASNPLG